MSDLIPQPHGGALRTPFSSGTGAAANRSSMRAIRKRGFRLLADGSEKSVRVLLECLDHEDARVRVIAATQILDRVHGKPGEKPQDDESGQEKELDLSDLSDEELRLLHKLARSGRLGKQIEREPETIEQDGTEVYD